jgi:hypothetical protein
MSDEQKHGQAQNNEPQTTNSADPLADVVKNHEEEIKKEEKTKKVLSKSQKKRIAMQKKLGKQAQKSESGQLSTVVDMNKSQEPEKSVIIRPRRKYQKEYNASNESKFSPRETLTFLSRFDDYQKINNGDFTHFQIMYRKLKADDRILDAKGTDEYLKSTGHNI